MSRVFHWIGGTSDEGVPDAWEFTVTLEEES